MANSTQACFLALVVVVTQNIVADDQTLLFIVYVMDRAAGNNSPSARLMSYWKYDHSDEEVSAKYRPIRDSMQ